MFIHKILKKFYILSIQGLFLLILLGGCVGLGDLDDDIRVTQKQTKEPSPASSLEATPTHSPKPTQAPTQTPQATDLGKATLYQLVPEKSSLMMSYLIITDKGKIIIIDGGIDGYGKTRPNYLFNEIKRISGQEKPVIDAWILTHVHYDHYLEFLKVYEEEKGNFTINEMYFNFPSDAFIEKYEPGEVQYFTKFKTYYNELYGKKAYENYPGVQVGDIIEIDNVSFEILFTPDERITNNAMNNSSIVFKMRAAGQSVLFTGDCGVEAGNQIVKTFGDSLKSDIVQMAHHGQAGVNKNFYEKVNPKVCLWPIPSWVWENTNNQFATDTTKRWIFDQMQVPHHYVSGLHGSTSIELPFDSDMEAEYKVYT